MAWSVKEEPFYEAVCNFALQQFLKGIRPKMKQPIVPWLAKHVDMTFDRTASARGYYKPYPYQIEELEATEDPNVHRITLCQSQRTGKSTIWRMALMKRFSDGNCSALIAYPSLDLAIKQNTDCVKPLLTMVPEVKADLAVRGNVKVDSYHSPSTSSVAYFMGLGSPVLSVTSGFLVADEVDFVELQNSDEEGKNTSQLKNIWLRGQTFPDRMMITVSSPTQYTAPIWTEFKKGSMGFWHLRCLGCGEYIIGNKLAFWNEQHQRFDGLQWEKDDNGNVIEESIIYRCPHCGHVHHECDAIAMNEQGKFIHQKPDHWHRSFQVGALGSSLWKWIEIAQAQEEAHDTTDNDKYFHNSILGMPFKYVKEGDASVSVEEANRKRQVEYPSDLEERLCIVTAGVDQQKSEISDTKYFCSAVHGWDENGNCWLLSAGTDNSLADVEKRINATYYGHKVALCLIDQGGFSTVDDLDPFVASHSNAFFYKGTNAKSIENKDYMMSKNQHKLFLCNALGYQVKLLDLLYSPSKPKGYKWYFPITVDAEYLKQVNNVQPNTRMGKDENGWEYANWASFGNSRRDFFDSSKMALCAMDIACGILPASSFKHGRKPMFYVKEQLLKLSHAKKLGRKTNEENA